jgi:hypothetical protein
MCCQCAPQPLSHSTDEINMALRELGVNSLDCQLQTMIGMLRVSPYLKNRWRMTVVRCGSLVTAKPR